MGTIGDIEFIILSVEKHPCLWNTNHVDYHSRDSKDNAWEEVCKDVCSDWDTTGDTEKKIISADLKKKWTNVRDCYRKDLQKNKYTSSGSSVKRQKRYIYSDVLSFLEPIFDKRNQESYYVDPTQELDDTNHRSEEQDSQNQDQYHQASQEEKSNQDQQASQEKTSNTQTKKKRKDVRNEILGIINRRNEMLDEDDDTKFLLSFRSEMKKMSSRGKIDFKIDMLELLKKHY